MREWWYRTTENNYTFLYEIWVENKKLGTGVCVTLGNVSANQWAEFVSDGMLTG